MTVEVTQRIVQFDETANQQRFEVTPQPPARLNSGNWNHILRDMVTDYPESLDLAIRKYTPADIRYDSPSFRLRNNQSKESWSFDWNGKVSLTRDVQLGAGKASLFDLDDFAAAAIKFCLHTLNAFLRIRPMPEALEYFMALTSLTGKVLQDFEMLEKAAAVLFVCRTSGRSERSFSVALSVQPLLASDSLRDHLLDTLNCIVGAFSAVGPAGLEASSPRRVSRERFAVLYNESLSRLNLSAVSALRKSADQQK